MEELLAQLGIEQDSEGKQLKSLTKPALLELLLENASKSSKRI